MNDRYINLVLALVTGRVWEKNPRCLKNKSIDIWDCDPWMEFIIDNFMPCIFPKEIIYLNSNNGYERALPGIKHGIGAWTTLDKKKAGTFFYKS